MLNASQQGRNGRASGGVFSLKGLISLGATIFVGPLVWPWVDGPVTEILVDLYRFQTAQYLAWAMELATYPITYFAIRAGVETALAYFNVLVIKRLV